MVLWFSFVRTRTVRKTLRYRLNDLLHLDLKRNIERTLLILSKSQGITSCCQNLGIFFFINTWRKMYD